MSNTHDNSNNIDDTDDIEERQLAPGIYITDYRKSSQGENKPISSLEDDLDLDSLSTEEILRNLETLTHHSNELKKLEDQGFESTGLNTITNVFSLEEELDQRLHEYRPLALDIKQLEYSNRTMEELLNSDDEDLQQMLQESITENIPIIARKKLQILRLRKTIQELVSVLYSSKSKCIPAEIESILNESNESQFSPPPSTSDVEKSEKSEELEKTEKVEQTPQEKDEDADGIFL